MELWIRSQDKQILTKVDGLILTNTGDIKSGNDIDTGIMLASYCPNYQRALEVLDEIQNILKPIIFVRQGNEEHTLLGARQAGITSTLETDFKELSAYVYEMPEE